MKNIREFLGLNKTEGEVGIEIEMETSKTPPYFEDSGGWRSEGDGSLRGFACEYVLNKPVMLSEVEDKINFVKDSLKKSGTEILDSERPGVHIHINVQELTPEEVIRFATLYYCFEEVLMRYCGESRVGNHHCLRISDAEGPIKAIAGLKTMRTFSRLSSPNLRYAALNFNSLFSYGSLEFRGMETTTDLSKIVSWAHILMRLKDFSVNNLNSRVEITEQMSYLGPEGYFLKVLGPDLYNQLSYDGMDKDILFSMRNIQEVLFSKELKS